MAEVVAFEGKRYGRTRAATKTVPSKTTKSKESLDHLRTNPKTSGSLMLGAAVLGGILWIGDKGEVAEDTCTSATHELVQVGAVKGPWVGTKNQVRSVIETLTFGTVINDSRTLSSVASTISDNRGYYVSTERLAAANKDAEFVQFDENGHLKPMPVEGSESGTFCVNVPSPIYGGYELVQSGNVTISQLAAQNYADPAVIRNLNPGFADIPDDQPLAMGTAVRITEAVDTTLVLREMSEEEQNINQLSGGDVELRKRLLLGNAALLAEGHTVSSGNRAFLPLSTTEYLEAKTIGTDVILASYDPANVSLDVGFIAEAPIIAAAAKEAAEQPLEILEAALATIVAPTPLEGAIPTAESDGTITINAERFGETVWTHEQLEKVQQNLPFYLEAERVMGVPWQWMATMHYRESDQLRLGPDNGQGPYQIWAERGTHKSGELTDAEFMWETMHAAEIVANDYVRRAGYDTPPSADNVDAAMQIFFAYNGMAAEYKAQAAALGFDPETQGYQGSPYVMNLVDDQRNSAINPNWKQFRADGGDFRGADHRPGAYLLYTGLLNVTEFIPAPPPTVTYESLQAKYNGESGHLEDSELAVIGEQWGGHRLNPTAAEKFREMNEAFNAQFGHDIQMTDSYRDYAGQVDVRQRKGGIAAVPGTSEHGWGFAVDLAGMKDTGEFDSPIYQWLRQNGPAYGWDNPGWARQDGSKPEYWHFEYGSVS